MSNLEARCDSYLEMAFQVGEGVLQALHAFNSQNRPIGVTRFGSTLLPSRARLIFLLSCSCPRVCEPDALSFFFWVVIIRWPLLADVLPVEGLGWTGVVQVKSRLDFCFRSLIGSAVSGGGMAVVLDPAALAGGGGCCGCCWCCCCWCCSCCSC